MAGGPGSGTYVVMDSRKLAELLRGPNGPVARRMLEDGELVKQEAQRLVGVSQPVPGERRSRPHGQLRDRIVKRLLTRGDELVVQVGADDPIALLHHQGTPPHVIHGKPLLVFYWKRVGRVVAFPKVNHPGTKPNHYLTDALRVLRGRY